MTMDTNLEGRDVLYQVTYGSKLYGTSTPTSDTDLKSVYLPAIDDLLLGKRLVATKTRVDEHGVKVPDNDSMPDRGVENEFIPFQTFVRDFVKGQTYAVEIAYAVLADGPSAPTRQSEYEFEMVEDMIEFFGNNEVYSMVGFAQKQTLDYVYRGERLNEALRIRGVIEDVMNKFDNSNEVRLDTVNSVTHVSLFDEIKAKTGLEESTTTNNNRVMRTLELNGRSYVETTTLLHLSHQLQKLIDGYGERTTMAAQTDVDYKSLSHAVRVYQQSIELLDHGMITFPRPNAAELLFIKQGKQELEFTKELLKELDAEVLVKMKTTKVRPRTPQLEARAEQWLLARLRELYVLG
jgi:hypothetical protein